MLPIMLPFLGGLWLYFFGSNRPSGSLYLILGATTLSVVTAALALNETMTFGYFPFHVVLSLQVDEISKVFSFLFVGIWIIVLRYSQDYFAHDGKQKRFFASYLCLLGALLGLCYANNLMTFYLFFELVSLCCIALVGHEQTEESIMATKKFLYYSMAGAFCSMVSIFYFYSIKTGNVEVDSMKFEGGGNLDLLTYGNGDNILFFTLVALVGFGCKAGMFPLHGWLKTAHPIAPAPASAVLSAVTTKAGVLAVIRVVYYTVGPDLIRGSYVQTWGIILSLLTIFMGSMLAYREKVLKTRLAYSTVSQVSYVLFGLLILNVYGFVGALLQVVFHALAKTLLFLCAGTIIHETHCHHVEELEGMGRVLPSTFTLFTLASCSLVGIPLTGGFTSKWYLGVGAMELGTLGYLGVYVVMTSALLTGGYLLTISVKGFFGEESGQWKGVQPPKGESVTVILGILICLLGVVPTLLIGIFEQVAQLVGLGGGL